MKFVILKQVVLSRPPEGPLAPHIVSFAESLREQGYSADSLKRQVRIVACFSRWLNQRRIHACSIGFAQLKEVFAISRSTRETLPR